jgi:hypothetical protein
MRIFSPRGKIPPPLLKSAERIYALPFGKKMRIRP